ncbi:MAG: tetratricopeptide repeat protein [Tepidisphaerales bacterium]
MPLRRPGLTALAFTLSTATAGAFAQPTARPPTEPSARQPAGIVRTLHFRTLDNQRGSTASLRGRLVVVFFFVPGTAAGDRILDAVRAVASLEGVGVAAVGVAVAPDPTSSLHPESLRNALDRHRIPYPVHVDEKTGGRPLARQWGFPSGSGIALLDPRGRVAVADVPPAQLDAALRRQLELTPPEPLPPDRRAAAAAALDLADTLLQRGRPRSAARVLSTLAPDSLADPALARQLGELLLRLEPDVPTLIALTEQLFEQDRLADAVVLLEQLASALHDSPARPAVDDQLNSFLDDPDLREKAEAGRPAALAADQLAFADDLADLGRELDAYRLYRQLVADHPGTPAAEEARRRIDNLEADADRRRRLRDALAGTAAAQLLQQAQAYRNAGLIDRARSLYQQVLTEHPGTSAAETARRELEALR